MNAKMSYFALPAILVLILALVPLSLSDYYLALLITIICNTALALSWQFFPPTQNMWHWALRLSLA